MARRGFFAELNHQMQQAEKNKRRQQAAAYRAQQAAERQAEKARRDMERAQAAATKASAKEQAEADKLAKALYQESRQADVDSMNADLANTHSEIDSMLAWTLSVDDFVDLNDLRVTVEHPPFDPGPLGQPVLPLPPLQYPPQPQYIEPPAPTGMFASKKRHEAAVQAAKAAHEAALAAWHAAATAQHQAYLAEQSRREQAERDRVAQLAQAQAQYEQECRDREAAAVAQNADLDKFINDLAFDVESAIQDYVGLVLLNSVWPDAFPVTIEHHFDLATRELTLTATVPQPSDVPAVKEYKYVKARDEVTSTTLPVKEQKDRYASAVWQVALRVLHEVFEADRAAKIRSISLTVAANRIAPHTGLPESVPLAIVAADRDTFVSFDLSQVVPHATLVHLGAAVSKSPYDMTPADTSSGVRVRGQA